MLSQPLSSVSVAEGLGGSRLFHERLQIADDLLGTLPVHRVAALGVYLQRRTGNRCREPFLFFAREEGILLPHKINAGTLISRSSIT
jgi:hypothetical protein